MSTTIDQRVVEMRFDNTQFEKNISQSTESLEKLRKSLELDNCAKAFDNIERAARGLNLSSITSSVQTVSSSFNALESIANGVLQRLGWNLEASISRFIHSFSQFSLFGQAGKGWEKYGDLTQSTQTIVAAGYAIDDVEAALERLNWYTDETSYNFTDMADNIGKFTAQGVDLEVAATAMQGISNWAARSGQTANEAGRAMYNLSQALSMGALTNMDWKSIENANMATREFKQTAIELGLELKTLKKLDNGKIVTNTRKAMEVTAETFRNTLSEKWLDDKVLLGTLEKYGSATNELYAIGEQTELTATQMLQALDSYQQGTGEWKNILAQNGSAYVSAEAFGKMLENLGREENELGLASFRMAQEALTFKQAMDAVSDAASTTWMNVFNKLFGTFEDARGLWTNVANDFYNIFVEPVNGLLNFISKTFDSGISQYEDLLDQAGLDSEQFEKIVLRMADEAGISSAKIREDIESGARSLYDIFTDPRYQKWGWNLDLIDAATNELIETTIGGLGNATGTVEEYRDLVKEIMLGSWGNGQRRKDRLKEAGYDPAIVQSFVNSVIAGEEITEEALAEAGITVGELSDEAIEKIESFRDETTELGKDVARAREMALGRSNRDLMGEGIHRSLEGIANLGYITRSVIEDLFDAAGESAVNKLIAGFNEGANSFKDFTASILESETTMEALSATADAFLGIFGSIKKVIDTVVSSVWNAVKALIPFKKDTIVIDDILSELTGVFEDVSGWIDGIAEKIEKSTFIADVINGIAAAFNFLYVNITNAFAYINSVLPEGEGIFDRLGKAISNWYQSFKENPKVQKYLGWLITAAENLAQQLPTFFDTVSEKFGAFIDYMDEKTDGGTNILKGIVEALGDLHEKVIAFFNFDQLDLKSFFENNLTDYSKNTWQRVSAAIQGMLNATFGEGNAASNALETLSNGASTFADATEESWWRIKNKFEELTTAFEPFMDAVKKVDFSKITATMSLAAMAGGFVRLSAGFDKIGDGVKNLTNPLGELKKVFTEMQGLVKAMKAQVSARTFTLIAVGVLSIAAAIVILFGAVYLLSKNVKNISELTTGLIALGIIMAFIVGFYVAVSAANAKFGGPTNAASVALIMLSLSIAVLIMIGALALLELVNPSVSVIVKLGAIMLGLAALVNLIEDGIRIDKAIGASLLLISFAGFLLIFAFSLWALDRVLGGLQNRLMITNILSLIVAALFGLGFMIKQYSAIILPSIATLVAIPLALLLFAYALKTLISMPWESMQDSLGTIIFGIIAVVGMMFIASKITGDASYKTGIAVALMASAIWIIAKSLEVIANLDIGGPRLFGIMTFIVIILGMLGVVAFALANSAGGEGSLKAAASITAIAAAIFIIVGALLLMELLDTSKLMIDAGILAVLIAILTLVIQSTKDATNQTKTILSFAALIAVIVLALSAMQTLDVGATLLALGYIAAVLVMLGLFMKVLSKMKGADATVKPIIAAVTLLAVIAIALGVLSNTCDPNVLLTIAVAMGILFVAIGYAMKVIGQFGAGAVGPLLSLAAVFIALGAGIALAAIGIEKFFKTLGSLDITQVAELGIKIGALAPNIIAGFILGIQQALPVIGGVIWNGIKSAFAALFGLIPVIWEEGKKLISALWEGIKNFDWEALGQWIWNALKSVWKWGIEGLWDFATSYDPGKLYYEGADAGESSGKGFNEAFNNSMKNDALSEAIRDQAPAANEAAEEVGSEAGDISIKAFMESLSNPDGGGTDFSSMLGGGFGPLSADGMSSFSSDLFTNFTNGEFNPGNMQNYMSQVGDGSFTGFSEGADPTKFASVANEIKRAITNVLNREAGEEIGNDFGSGIESGARDAVEVNSPSRKFYEIGEYCVKGLVNAVQHLSGTAANAGYDLGINVLTATSESLAGMYAILEGEEMIMPSIGLVSSPTSFQNGINAGNGLNGGTYAFGSAGYSKGVGASSNSVTTNNPVFNIYQQPNQSPEDLAAIINRELGRLYV